MVRKWLPGELKEELEKIEIIIDSREQANSHITNFFDQKNVPYKVRKLDSGDYSATIGNLTLEHDVVIERKNSITELCGNMGQNRTRFENEFNRIKASGTKPFLLIENNTIDDVFIGNYRSQFKPKSLMASIYTWMVRYNVTVLFCKPENTGKLIYGIMYYYARELLETDGK